MIDVFLSRPRLLRAIYLLIAVGLCTVAWPSIGRHSHGHLHLSELVLGTLAAIALLALVGTRHPGIHMLPLLACELAWKINWVWAFGSTCWLGERLDSGQANALDASLMGLVLLPLVVPLPRVLALIQDTAHRRRSAAIRAGSQVDISGPHTGALRSDTI